MDLNFILDKNKKFEYIICTFEKLKSLFLFEKKNLKRIIIQFFNSITLPQNFV